MSASGRDDCSDLTYLRHWWSGLVGASTSQQALESAPAPSSLPQARTDPIKDAARTESPDHLVKTVAATLAWQQQAPFEKVSWFQAILDALWPALRACLERDVVRGILEPALAKAGLHVENASLGDQPPQLYGVQTLITPDSTGDTSRKDKVQLIFDVGFEPGRSLNISFGMGPIRAGVRDLKLRGRLCVCLVGIVPRSPIVRGIKVFFANAPSLSFSFGGLAKALPIPPQTVKEYIQEALATKLVLPHALNLHLDCLVQAFSQPDFLPYHSLHSMPPVGILRVVVEVLNGPKASMGITDPSWGLFGTNWQNDTRLYVLLRVGGKASRTKPLKVNSSDSMVRLSWPGEQHAFLVDSLTDQDLQLEVYSKDQEHLFWRCDEPHLQAKVSIAALARALAENNTSSIDEKPAVEIPLVACGETTGAVSAVSLTCSGRYQPLIASKPESWQGRKAVMQVTVDSIVNLKKTFDGKRFFVLATLTNATHTPDMQKFKIRSSTRRACRGQVAAARALHAKVEELRWGEVKARIRLLLSKGGTPLTPAEISWLLPGMVSQTDAARLLKEVLQEEAKREAGSSDEDYCVELLFEEQLRLEVQNPATQGLRVELHNEETEELVGVVAWSSLSWLAQCPSLDEDLRSYELESPRAIPSRGPSSVHVAPKIFMRRALLRLDPEAPNVSATLPTSHISEANVQLRPA
eukprot:TRINITY_DN48275_c0_g1_i1.p1 TRINITY_DN48275_c0_g1~~TRINITY_DN48275_c0_g1_i1.p1  ORF type:complete len:694 (+),score=85.25 TRINITY_DN48275_c0_g1_i1:112-2193(+)